MLLAFLQRQRDLVAWKCADLPDSQARAVATPTGLTVHGVVQHLAAVERLWVRGAFAGQVPPLEDWHATSQVAGDVSLVDLLEAYAEEARRCDEVIAAASLEDTCGYAPATLRWVLHHLVEETARHVGHLDLLCELADGRTGEDPLP
jgi:uncharacterized damage-inducible protein DinB